MKKISILFISLLCLCFTISAQNPIRDLNPTVILVSIDGFRSDYLETYKPKILRKLAKRGARAKWMTPSFPSKTFPNHYTIATGLLPENHGIVANNIYDPEFDAIFSLGKREEVQNPRWWQGEPIWVTAEKQGQIAASYFFPGTETAIGGKSPTYWKPYDGKVPNEERVDTVLKWLDLPIEKRPTMITMYFSTIDDAGHNYSPNSAKTGLAIKEIDKIIGRLVKGLKKRKIYKKANLVIVSDHGMASVPQKNAIILDEMFDTSDAARIFWVGEFVQIFPKPGRLESIYEQIKSQLSKTAEVFRRGEIPSRYRYRNNRRIAPIVVIPKAGWYLTKRERFEKTKAEGRLQDTRGSHGYDNEDESMRALFIGHGTAFRKGFVSEPFQNIHVYNLMCKILRLKPAPNDGSFDEISSLLRIKQRR